MQELVDLYCIDLTGGFVSIEVRRLRIAIGINGIGFIARVTRLTTTSDSVVDTGLRVASSDFGLALFEHGCLATKRNEQAEVDELCRGVVSNGSKVYF